MISAQAVRFACAHAGTEPLLLQALPLERHTRMEPQAVSLLLFAALGQRACFLLQRLGLGSLSQLPQHIRMFLFPAMVAPSTA
jgi:hypothetical protein